MSGLISKDWLQRQCHVKDLSPDPESPFPVGVEYYRPPVPPTEFWDEDFRRIKEAGMQIVRSFYPWNWVETEPERFELEDMDLMFELAARHGLRVWLDTPLGTHMACPEWMISQHPDMAAVRQDGSVQQPVAGEFACQGVMIHNFDHPMWRVYVERYLRVLVPRYKDHPAMGIWGTWDGIGVAAAWSGGEGYPPYNDYTLEKYRLWLQRQYTLEQLNERLLRRFRAWKFVEPPRTNDAIVEMMLYRQFHYENMADHLGWMADLIDCLDGQHEQRSHGGSYPRQQDEVISPFIDSWGLSHHSANRLTTEEPYSVASECFGFQWCRLMGRGGRWWNEEIYGSFVGGLAPREKMTTGEESAAFLWLTLMEGGAGALYWQYRPEYMTFEGPGLNLVALDGEPTSRWHAVREAISQIDSIADHLPPEIPPAEMAIGYSGLSHEVFFYNDREHLFLQQLRGLYRALWPDNIPQDIVTPHGDWSAYKLVYLPNFAVLDEVAIARLRSVLEDPQGPRLVVDGYFGTFADKGHWSFRPPEGLHSLIDTRVADFDMINEADIRAGKNVLRTEFGEFPISHPASYSILEPRGDMQAVAWIGDQVVGVRSPDARFTWFGISLAATGRTSVSGQPGYADSAGVVHPGLASALVGQADIHPWFDLEGDRLVALRRGTRQGGSLVFLLNVEPQTARTQVRPNWPIQTARDLLGAADLPVQDGAFSVEIPFGQVGVIHCTG